MTWNSQHHKGRWEELEDFYNYQFNNKNMNSHNFRMFLGLAVVFITGAISAMSGGFTVVNVIAMVVAGLIAVEHSLNGNTGVPPTTE